MAGGLIIAAAAIGNLWLQISGNESAILLLDSLAWYAALPLLITVRMIQAAQHLGFDWHWDRIIWGRILLALCAVFEVCRRANQLDMILYVSSVVGVISLFVIAIKHTATVLVIPAIAACAASVGYFVYQPSDVLWLIAPILVLITFKLSHKNSKG